MGVDLGTAQAAVAQQQLDYAQMHAGLQQMRGEAVPQAVHRDTFDDPGAEPCPVEHLVHRGASQRPLRVLARKQPVMRPLELQYSRSTTSSLGESIT